MEYLLIRVNIVIIVQKHVTPISFTKSTLETISLFDFLNPSSTSDTRGSFANFEGMCITTGKWSDISEYTIAEAESITRRLIKLLLIRIAVFLIIRVG